MKVPLRDWATARYSPAPSDWILRKWVRDGAIYPAPEKVGKHYYVETTAERMTDQPASLVQRLRAA